MSHKRSHDLDTPDTFSSLALSFSEQPILRELFDHLQDPDAKLTIFCGAGVSVDSGLPTWRQLVHRLSEQVPVSDLRDVLQADGATLTRKVGLILQVIRDMRRGPSEDNVIAEALYDDDSNLLPSGQLAAAIARLAVALTPARVRIATTNYDDRMERALAEYGVEVAPMGLSQANTWFTHSFVPGRFEVLHLHGFLASDDRWPSMSPVVLSESHYLREGHRVQGWVKQMLTTSTTLFIGVSMTDPSIIGPLSEVHAEKSADSVFTILVPDSGHLKHEDPPGMRAHAYTEMVRRYLDKELGVSPVVLKSYAQVAQLVVEGAAAVSRPEEFNDDNPDTSLRYGLRFQRVLGRIHESIHVAKGRYGPSDEHAQALSDHLQEALVAPVEHIDEAISRKAADHQRYGIPQHFLREEQYALFLWLRAMREADDRSPIPYRLFQAGSSAYSQRSGVLSTKYHWVVDDARFAAPKCVYFGRSQITTLREERDRAAGEPIWRSFLATPLVCTEAELGVGTLSHFPLTVGAVVLHASRRIVRREEMAEDYARNIHIERLRRPSTISLMNRDELAQLMSHVATAGKQVLRSVIDARH